MKPEGLHYDDCGPKGWLLDDQGRYWIETSNDEEGSAADLAECAEDVPTEDKLALLASVPEALQAVQDLADLRAYLTSTGDQGPDYAAAFDEMREALLTIVYTADSADDTGHEPGDVVGGNWDLLGRKARAALALATEAIKPKQGVSE